MTTRRYPRGCAALLLGSALLGGCASKDSTQAEDPAVAATSALADSADSAHALALGGFLEVLHGPSSGDWRAEAQGTRCDPSPELTWSTVCGKQVPATAHFEWTQCEGGLPRPEGHARRPPPDTDGGLPPPPHGAPPGHGASSGVVDVATTVTAEPEGECTADTELHSQEVATFDVQREGPDGTTQRASGTYRSTSTRLAEATRSTEQTQVDTTRTVKDADGSAVSSVHLTGTLSVTFDTSAGAPTRTFDGALSAARSDGSTDVTTLEGLVRPSPRVCEWPTAGSIERVGADGAAHTLAFGPDCGQATLDGSAVTLPERGGPRGGGGRPPRPPPTL